MDNGKVNEASAFEGFEGAFGTESYQVLFCQKTVTFFLICCNN